MKSMLKSVNNENSKAAIDDKFVTQTWEMLQKALMEILHKNNSGLSFEELYRNSYTMVLHKRGDMLYQGLQTVVSEHLKSTVRRCVEESIKDRFLDTLNKAWTDHTTAMVMIRDILMYMDRVYVQQNNVTQVFPLGLQMFRNEILDHPVINQHLKATLLNMVALERSQEVIEWIDLKNASQMLLALSDNRKYYEVQFEDYFLAESAEHYRNASQKFLDENSASVYVQQVNACLEEEAQRAERYLDKITEGKIIEVLKKELIVQHMKTVVEMENSGMTFMLTNRRAADLKAMYELFKRVPNGTSVMTQQMSKFLRERGKSLVEDVDNTNPVQYIQNLIDLKDQFDKFLADSFLNDNEFKEKMQGDFVYFFNINLKSPEFLSIYIDDKLRKGLKSLNEGDAEKELDKAMILFKFLQEKDVFERYYKQHLAKRLLLGKSISDDSEKSMISKLKTECGCQFTSKLEGMFKDMALSETIMADYRAHCDVSPVSQPGTGVELTVNVLTKVFWPTNQNPICNLPLAADTAFTHFAVFYMGKHSGRKIALNPCLGSADVKATFYGAGAMEAGSELETDNPGPSNSASRRRDEQKILQVSTYQMVILLQFNERSRFSFQELSDRTKVPEKDLKRCLLSLAMGKSAQRVLCRTGTGKEIEPTDSFVVNDAFTSKFTRIKVQMVSGRADTEPECRATRTKVEDDRRHEIEAAIVRVMKARKRLLHNDLITEVTNQLRQRFLPDPIVIKKRIESLIEREYLLRDKEDHKFYNYLA